MVAKRGGPFEIDLVLVAFGDDLVIRSRDEPLRRIVSARQFRQREPAVPLIAALVAGHRKQARPPLSYRRGPCGLPAYVAIHIGIHQILRRDSPSLERFQEFLPVLRSVQRERREIPRRSGLAANPSQRIRAMKRRVFIKDRSVTRESKVDIDVRRLALHFDRFALDLHLLPFVFVAILSRIRRICFFNVEVLLIDSDNGESEPNSLVVTGRDSRKRRLSRADDVPTGPDQVNEIAQRWQTDASMRIIRKNRFARVGERTAYDPVVGTFARLLT